MKDKGFWIKNRLSKKVSGFLVVGEEEKKRKF